MADIEYNREPRDGTLKLIEMNPRHWDWHQLGSVSGVNLTWAAYSHLTGRPVQPVQQPVQRAKWIAEDSLLRHMAADFYRGERGPLKAWKQLSGQRMYGIFAWSDPVPFLRYSVT